MVPGGRRQRREEAASVCTAKVGGEAVGQAGMRAGKQGGGMPKSIPPYGLLCGQGYEGGYDAVRRHGRGPSALTGQNPG
jgi:hypothetical protein